MFMLANVRHHYSALSTHKTERVVRVRMVNADFPEDIHNSNVFPKDDLRFYVPRCP